MPPSSEALARSFKAFVEGSGPTITGGWIQPLVSSLVRVTVKRSQKDLLLNKSRPSLQSYVVETSTGSWTALPPVPIDPGTLMISGSPSGKFYAVVRKDSAAGGSDNGAAKSKTVVELWGSDSGSVLSTIHVESKVHGDPCGDSWFGAPDGVSWSADESCIAYVAEAPPPESLGFLDPSSPPAPGKEPPSRGGQFDYANKESWGERYETTRCPRLFVAHWGSGRVLAVPGIPETVSAGGVVWAPSAAGEGRYALVFTGWLIKYGRRLGSVYCYNRPCGIYGVDVTALIAGASTAPQPASASGQAAPEAPAPPAPVLLTPGDSIARSPRFSPDGSALAYLSMSGPARYMHNGASSLKLLPWRQWLAEGGAGALATGAPAPPPDAQSLTIIPTVDVPATAGGKPTGKPGGYAFPPSFPSLYTHLLPGACFSGDGSSLYVTSVWGFRHVVLRVDLPVAMPFTPPRAHPGAPGSDAASASAGSGSAGAGNVKWAHIEIESATEGISPLGPVDPSGPQDAAELPRSSGLVTVCPLPADEFGAGASALLVVSSSPTAPERLGLVISHSSGGPVAQSQGLLSSVFGSGRSRKVSRCLPCPSAPVPPFLAPLADSTGETPQPFDEITAGLAWRLLRSRPLEPASGDAPSSSASFESLLLWPSAAASASSSPLPLVVVPHGGPHSAFTADWIGPYAWLASHGYAVLTVNYRGSLGYGEAATASLPGRAGMADVSDTYAAAVTALLLSRGAQSTPIPGVDAATRVTRRGGLPVDTLGQASLPVALDPARVSVCGGSHGGFLAAHLIGQHAELFRAAVMRNPVTNIAAMASITDIAE